MFLISKDYYEIKNTKEKGKGVFAKLEIKAGTIIGDYLGKVIHSAKFNLDSDKLGLYLMYFSDTVSLYPDPKKPGVHLLNHSCRPNCWIYTYRGHTLIFALREIQLGKELTISYLLNPKDNCKECTHICKCNLKSCAGTFHLPKDKYDLWQEFQKNQSKKTRRTKAVVGKNLAKLKSYPKIDFNNPIYKKLTK